MSEIGKMYSQRHLTIFFLVTDSIGQFGSNCLSYSDGLSNFSKCCIFRRGSNLNESLARFVVVYF